MKNKKGGIIIFGIFVLLILIIGISYVFKKFDVDADVNINLNEKNQSENNTEIANPSSEFCISNGHKTEMRISKNKGEYGVCIDSKGNECEEWEYFRGECNLSEE